MTTKRKSEILRVLQEKYGVLKDYVIEFDYVRPVNTTDVRDFDHGVVLDALWEWIRSEVRKPNPLFYIHCDGIKWLIYTNTNEYYSEVGADSENKWHMTEYILQQKGVL